VATKERFQNPVVGDTIRLRLQAYNGHAYRSVNDISQVEVYYLDPAARSPENPDGRTLFAPINGADVVEEAEGKYYVDLPATRPQFLVGNYVDVWTVEYEAESGYVTEEHAFAIYPPLWITSPVPIVYDFAFRFSPNKIVKGSKKALQIEVAPLVPRYSDLVKYYQNLITLSDIRVKIVQRCGACLPEEEDLRTVVEWASVDYREGCVSFYTLDTCEMEKGIYDVQFKMCFGDNVFISEPQQLQIF
jgi:hypothetical protein